jgi:hypothetical protein
MAYAYFLRILREYAYLISLEEGRIFKIATSSKELLLYI